MKQREIWLDYLRVFACILVSVGHLFLSFQESGIRDTLLISYGIQVIYHFHVYIFFFCSGYLLQKSVQRYTERMRFAKSKLIRGLDFLIIYILFSGITFGIKILLSGDVNSPVEHTFLEVLLSYPINQMWYMYAICVITLCTVIPRTERELKLVVLGAIGLKIIMCVPGCSNYIPIPLNYLFDNQIWYVMGMLWAYKRIELPKRLTALFTAVFITVSSAEFFLWKGNDVLDALLTFAGLAASAGWFSSFTANKTKMPRTWALIAKYMLQIYLLHTIFAAGIRIVLLRLGIASFWVHLPLGILFSIVAPIVCGAVAERIPILNVVFYPSKTVKKLRG